MHYETLDEKQNRESNKTIYYCLHCKEELGMTKKIYCNGCRLKANRQEMDANNARILKGLSA